MLFDYGANIIILENLLMNMYKNRIPTFPVNLN